MENEGKITELLSESLKRQDQMVFALGRVETEVYKLNLQTAENSRAILKLADELRMVADHERRISKLESTVFK